MPTGYHPNSTAWRSWVDRARAQDILHAAKSLGAKLRKIAANEYAGPCPWCGGEDRFGVNDRKQIFICRGGGRGDVIAMVQHVTGGSFNEACERLTGEERPDRSRDETLDERNARLQANAERSANAQAREEEERKKQAAKEKRDEQSISDIIDRSVAVEGTHAEAYMHARGLRAPSRLTRDLRFVDKLEYWGARDNGSGEPAHLATVPALIALIRNFAGIVTGYSETYLDPHEPRKWKPTGSPYNANKKTRGIKKGGMIRLGRITECLAIAEGWENALAWWQMGQGPEDMSLAAAVDLGNLAGSSLGNRAHPVLTDNDGRPRRISNGRPDPASPGVILPKDMGIKSIILLADVDSESYATAALLATATRRFQGQGLHVGIAWPATEGADHNDVLLADLASATQQQQHASGAPQ